MATYPVTCECGTVQQVSATQAGSKLLCTCGKSVEVPSLVRLKASAGESSISADFEIEHLLHMNALPEEHSCCQCKCKTNHIRHALVECETTTLKESKVGNPKSSKSHFGLFGWLFMPSDDAVVHGRILNLKLPFRVCESCSISVKSDADARQSLALSPLYARLLDKYPKAKVKLVPSA